MNDTLVVYFSGNDPKKSATADAARNLASVTGADLYEIRPQNPYSKDFNTVVQEAQRDKDMDSRPALAGPSIDVKPYRTIILGFPNWCGTAPMPVFSFLDEHMKDGSLIGKRIIPFVINDGSGMQHSVTISRPIIRSWISKRARRSSTTSWTMPVSRPSTGSRN